MPKLPWRAVMATLTDMTEDQVSKMLDDEINVYKRPAVARRLHQRLSTLRAARERKDIMRRIKQ